MSKGNLKLNQIEIDPTLQPRVDGIDSAHVAVLQAAPSSWPPIAVVERDGQFVLIDGAHRFAAAQNLGLAEILADVLAMPADGDLAALAFALNAAHGRPLSLDDRRAFAGRLLRLHADWADREIGRRCGLAQPTVATVRAELERTAQIEQTATRVGQGGYTYAVGANVKRRPPGELPGAGFGAVVGDAVGRLFSTDERREQRRITQYLEHLAIALEDQESLDGWDDADQAAHACSLVLGEGRAKQLGERLGWTSRNVLDVAYALGFDDADDAA